MDVPLHAHVEARVYTDVVAPHPCRVVRSPSATIRANCLLMQVNKPSPVLASLYACMQRRPCFTHIPMLWGVPRAAPPPTHTHGAHMHTQSYIAGTAVLVWVSYHVQVVPDRDEAFEAWSKEQQKLQRTALNAAVAAARAAAAAASAAVRAMNSTAGDEAAGD